MTTNETSCWCGSTNIIIVTPAVHVGSLLEDSEVEGLESFYYDNLPSIDEVYFANNDNSSWKTTGDSRFKCKDCDTSWPVDREVKWVWND